MTSKVMSTQASKATIVAGQDAKNHDKRAAIRYPFWFGGSASSMAACVTHPLDLVKVRLQMHRGDTPKSMSRTFAHILRQDGPLALYSGLSASLLRQITYSTVRFGVYEELKTRAIRAHDGKQPGMPTLVGMAALSGFLGGISGNAADVLNVRMQHDAALPPTERYNYKNGLHGMFRMARDEGPKSWFRGVWPNSVRASIMTAGQLASYDGIKRTLVRHTPMKDNLTTHFTASFLAGVVAATVTSPVDVIKTRAMSASGKESIFNIIGDLVRKDKFRWMFKGWTPSFLRLGPQTVCTFVFLEMHRKTYRKWTESGLSI